MTRAQANTLLIAQALAEPGCCSIPCVPDTGRWQPRDWPLLAARVHAMSGPARDLYEGFAIAYPLVGELRSKRLETFRRVAREKYGVVLDYSALERRTGVVVGRWVKDPHGGLKLELLDADFVP